MGHLWAFHPIFWFSFLADEVTKIPEYYVTYVMYIHFLKALQTETIIKKEGLFNFYVQEAEELR